MEVPVQPFQAEPGLRHSGRPGETTRPVAVFFWGPRLRAATPARPSAASATTVLRPKRFGGGGEEASTAPYCAASCIVY